MNGFDIASNVARKVYGYVLFVIGVTLSHVIVDDVFLNDTLRIGLVERNGMLRSMILDILGNNRCNETK